MDSLPIHQARQGGTRSAQEKRCTQVVPTQRGRVTRSPFRSFQH